MVISSDILQQVVAQAQEADWNNAVGAVLTKPTAANIVDLTTYPDRLAAVAPQMGNPSQRHRNVSAALDFLGLMNHGEQAAALEQLRARKQALVKGKESTEVTDTMIAALRMNDPELIARAKGLAGMVLAASVPFYELPDMLKTAGFKNVPEVKSAGADEVEPPPSPAMDETGDPEVVR
ncbi:beta-phosphoglucomutase-like phosphatase (HAD superfamily) [Sphingomonas jinjuensis]|uniref:Beta-phosphoglucomutase-like phosphatase (HAD superfamily) n=1 Tax=Sphingomonas jinjuensis TaxID=535907 RepID=A0A840FBB1_9SPHN|nr:hypothetical protein [Sphingomonas jinjuensis]MBB4155310.1 beta-phosphoglucomutase-like phosphatase (HAD superfamily) [Sphingomonas jinjuensis]